jgi:hypothetical protein
VRYREKPPEQGAPLRAVIHVCLLRVTEALDSYHSASLRHDIQAMFLVLLQSDRIESFCQNTLRSLWGLATPCHNKVPFGQFDRGQSVYRRTA